MSKAKVREIARELFGIGTNIPHPEQQELICQIIADLYKLIEMIEREKLGE